MRLTTRTWGTGARTAVLVHGYSDDSSTWWRVGPWLAEQGWTVVAPDLRGHGRSPRAASYQLEDFADDLVETLPTGLDLLLGHSLGALAVGLAAARLAPRQAVLVDPPWSWRTADIVLGPLPTQRAQLAHLGWDDDEVTVDLASSACVDPLVAGDVFAAGQVLSAPPAAVPSLVVVPDTDPLLPVGHHDALRALGYDLRTVPGTRHVVHRDDLDGFLAALPLDASLAL